MATVNYLVHNVCEKHFIKMLENGAFPKIQYKVNKNGYTSYALYEYLEVWSRFMKLVDEWVRKNVDSVRGIYTRKRNQGIVDSLQEYVENITEKDISEYPERFGIKYYD